MAAHDVAPYKQIITHGWVVDGEGKQMHKSTGNAISPNEVVNKSGAEILRLWAAAVDYTQDMRCSEEILSRIVDAYRKFRNTLRYALGNLDKFDPETDTVEESDLIGIDRWALAELNEVTRKALAAYEKYDFQGVYQVLYNFCTVTLSARYFDIIKDRLYIFAPKSQERRSAQTALYRITDALCRLMSVILAFTTDEAWENLPGQKLQAVHMAEFPVASEVDNSAFLADWERVFSIRDQVLRALEEERNAKEIGSSLDAKVILTADADTTRFLMDYFDQLRYLFIVSQVEVREGAGLSVQVRKADGEKCERCWNYSTRVGESNEYPTVCERCVAALGEIVKGAAA
jgi:isoleucyl-tRNA synthetase